MDNSALSTNKTLDLITIGESMIRFTPPGANRLETAEHLNVFIGGAESNIAVGGRRLGLRTAWVSRLPDHPLAHHIANTLRQHGVDVSGARWTDTSERLGLYFVEQGSAPRPARVWYDRANSAASHMTPDDLPRDLIASARWLHLTGITPALSASCAATAHAALDHARQNGLTVSFDVNYRALLWSPEAARETLTPFCEAADIVFVAARDGRNLFGTDDLAALRDTWGGTVIVTRGADGAAGLDDQGLVEVEAFPTTMVDRLGAGDALAIGAISQLMEGASLAEALRFGCATAALKLTIPGDFALVTRREVEELIERGGGSIHR